MTAPADERYFKALRIFVAVAALSPMLCCAGCLGLGLVTSLLTPPPATVPLPTAHRPPPEAPGSPDRSESP